MASTVIASGSRARLFASAPLVGLGLAIIAALMLVAGPLGWRTGLLSYRIGLLYLLPYAAYAALAGLVISALALLVGRGALGQRGLMLAIAGVIVGGAIAYFPWHYSQLRGKYPPIHDITTDTANPPGYTAVLPARAAEHGNTVEYDPKVAAQQQKAYPGIAPLDLPIPPHDAYERALAAAKAKGWAIAAADPVSGHIEASDRSFWFGFTDDVSIRVTPAGNGSRIDVRSVARQGRGDFGVNAARIRGYLDALRAG
jgi:uncharacterized protein (DUF1499 family)